MVYSYTFSSR